jgi:hypothetical protein
MVGDSETPLTVSRRAGSGPWPRGRRVSLLDELEDKSTRVAAALSRTFFESVNRADVRMIERSQHRGLALEACPRSGSCAKISGSILIATSRLSFRSRARYTSPMPPAPSELTISYGPRRVPEGSITSP